jgi:hypothetical protein
LCQVNELKLHVRCKSPEDPCIIFVQKIEKQVGVCDKCWKRIADKDWEVGNSPTLTMEEILSDKSRGLEGAVLTEYKYRGVKESEPKSEEEEIE